MLLLSGAVALQFFTIVLVNAQDKVPDTPENLERRCAYAPCPESYIENGVEVVIQLAVDRDPDGGVVCCNYDKFTQSVDPPKCCYSTSSRALVRGRFSCPQQGIPKPANCPTSSTTTSSSTSTTSSSTPQSPSSTPSGITRAECQNTFTTFKDVCSAIGLLGNLAGLPCPSGSITDLINAVFTQILFAVQIQSGDPREEVDKTFFANTLFATIGIGLGIGALIAGGPILVPIIASIVEGLTAICTLASRIQFAGSICSTGAIVLELAECAGLPNKRRSISGSSSHPYINAAEESSDKKHPSKNVCSDLLAFFPSPSQCSDALAVPSLNCANLTARTLVYAGASGSDANKFITDCEAVEADRKNLVKLCKIRDALEDFVPFCDSDGKPDQHVPNPEVPCNGADGCGHHPPANPDVLVVKPCHDPAKCGHHAPAHPEVVVVKPCNDPEKCDKNPPARDKVPTVLEHCNGANGCDKYPANPDYSRVTEAATKVPIGPTAPYNTSRTSNNSPGETDIVLFTSGAWELGLTQIGHLLCFCVAIGIMLM